jgi:SAM-dependent methyltransferase
MPNRASAWRSSPDWSRRSTATEWLDGAGADARALETFLRDLARFNAAMLGHRAVLAWLRRATRRAPGDRPFTLLDVGCGYGDLLRAIRRWARKRGVPIRLVGLDHSRETIRIARAASDNADGIEYRAGDVFEYRPPEPVDFVVSSLLAHHLSDERIAALLRFMEAAARRGWLIYDLQRHPVPHYFIGLVGRLTRLSPLMIEDGRISVARALTAAEWRERLAAADISPASVRLRWFLFRFVIGRLK